MVTAEAAHSLTFGANDVAYSEASVANAGLNTCTTVLIGGKRVNDLAPSERNIAMVFQNYALYPHMDVASNIAFGLRLAGLKKPEIESRVRFRALVLPAVKLRQAAERVEIH